MTAMRIPVRRRGWLTTVVAVVGVIAAATFTFLAASGSPERWELRSFRTINELPDWLNLLLWPLMQYGALAAIPVVAAVAWLRGRPRLAASLGVAALGGYLLAKVVKEWVGRGRPAVYLDGVIEREAFGEGSLGYPSGHAVVAATITTALAHVVPRPQRIGLVALTLAVLLGRVYAGGHLALDVIGGAAMGVALGAAATLAVDGRQEHEGADHGR
jgi:membrane-associated phospholipid phosphatase